jgi:two-component system, NarL family, response regulator DesR
MSLRNADISPVLPSSMSGRMPRVLVADDTPAVARRIRGLLQEDGDIEVVGLASDGVEALRLFEETAPDGVVLDFNMPRLNGADVLRSIRRSGRACLSIVLTNHAEPGIREACLAAGADHVLQKATGFGRIPAIVREHFGRSSAS